jgi:hypothetical protein
LPTLMGSELYRRHFLSGTANRLNCTTIVIFWSEIASPDAIGDSRSSLENSDHLFVLSM